MSQDQTQLTIPRWQEKYKPQIHATADGGGRNASGPASASSSAPACGEPLELVSALSQARLRTAGHRNRPPADVRRRALRPPRAGAVLPREQLLHRRERARHHPGGPGRLHADLSFGHPAPVRLRPAAAGRGADPGDAAGRARHVQLWRVGGHRQERGGERLARHRPGEPEHAAHAGRLLHSRLRHRRAGARRTRPSWKCRRRKSTDTTRQIAEYIAALVEDGSTLEFGIGRIPQALLGFLKDKKDLGIHTEMISDGIIDLIESGAVTGARKTVDRGKVVTSFCLGHARSSTISSTTIPSFAFHPTEYVNDPVRHPPATQDGGDQHGAGGRSDRARCAPIPSARSSSPASAARWISTAARPSRAAARRSSPCPRPPRTAPSRASSTHLSPGAGVVTTRAGVHYVVTEYGVAYLHGKSIQERALALISIAHPKFRADLLTRSHRGQISLRRTWRTRKARSWSARRNCGRPTCSTTARSSTSVRFIRPTSRACATCSTSCREATIYYRFMSHQKRVSRQQIQDFVYIDHRNDVTIVGTLPEASRRRDHRGRQLLSRPEDQPGRSGVCGVRPVAEPRHRHLPAEASDAHRAPQRHPRLHRGSARARTSPCRPSSTSRTPRSAASSPATCSATRWISSSRRESADYADYAD